MLNIWHDLYDGLREIELREERVRRLGDKAWHKFISVEMEILIIPLAPFTTCNETRKGDDMKIKQGWLYIPDVNV